MLGMGWRSMERRECRECWVYGSGAAVVPGLLYTYFTNVISYIQQRFRVFLLLDERATPSYLEITKTMFISECGCV